jgi:hypothetical protein
MSEVRPRAAPANSLVRAAYEYAAMRRPDTVGSPPNVFFVAAGRPSFEADVLVRLVALGNQDAGEGRGAVCVYDLPHPEVEQTRAWLQELAEDAIEPPMDLATSVLPTTGKSMAVVTFVLEPRPPYLIKLSIGSQRRGECWVYREGSFRPATRADLDQLYARTAAQRPGGTDAAHDALAEPLSSFKERLLNTSHSTSLAMLAHQLAILGCSAIGHPMEGGGSASMEPGGPGDRILCIGLAGVTGGLPSLAKAAARALRTMYLLASAEDVPAELAQAVAEEAIARFFLLGALATHRRDWAAAASLTAETVPGRARGEYPFADHPLFVAGPAAERSLHDFFDRAMDLGQGQTVFREDFGSEDLLTSAVCQWDLLAAAVSPRGSSHYPNFARFEKVRVAPLVAIARDAPDTLAPVLGDDPTGRIEQYLSRLEEEIGQDFATFAPWWAWGQTFDELA